MKKTAIPRTLKYWRVATGLTYQGLFYPRGELIAAVKPGKKLLDLVVKKMVRREADPKQGRCMRCGCTWGSACAGGCKWANVKRTVCSGCSAFAEGK
jgi:hypothetical protein